MKIKEILSQNRRDMQCLYECESCNDTTEGYGYDDRNFHENVIPKMACKKCGETAKNYRPLTTKYDDFEVV